MYIDYAYYLQNGGSLDVDSAAFSRIVFRAEKIIDRYTQSRVRVMAEAPEAVKLLMVELVTLETTQAAAVAENQAITSFTNDGYSESYAEPLTTEKVKEIENNLILTYLMGEADDKGVPLLYLGVD